MSAQTTYGFSTSWGAAGGIVDLAPYAVDTFLNEENDGVMQFGVGVVSGTAAGKGIKLPASTTGYFEGITTNNRSTEYGLDGKIYVRKNASVGVMRYGKIYGKLATGATPAYGDPVYVVAAGAEKGYLTDVSTSNMPINAVFCSGANNGVAMIDLMKTVVVAPAED